MKSITQMPLRLPASLHQALKAAAQGEGVSLNQYCLYLLARSSPTKEDHQRRKAEDLLRFLEEAALLQKEFDKTRKATPREVPAETPYQRLRKIHGKN